MRKSDVRGTWPLLVIWSLQSDCRQFYRGSTSAFCTGAKGEGRQFESFDSLYTYSIAGADMDALFEV
jgi:hypothetical protein